MDRRRYAARCFILIAAKVYHQRSSKGRSQTASAEEDLQFWLFLVEGTGDSIDLTANWRRLKLQVLVVEVEGLVE
jgi:hypothetical protein